MVRQESVDEAVNLDSINGFREKRVLSQPPLSGGLAQSGSKSAFQLNRCNQIMKLQNTKKRQMLGSKVNVRVSIIGQGQVVGLEDMSKDDSVIEGKHQATVTCISEKGSALFLSSENFFGFLYRHINKEHISEEFDAKLPFYNRRVERVMSVQKSLEPLYVALGKASQTRLFVSPRDQQNIGTIHLKKEERKAMMMGGQTSAQGLAACSLLRAANMTSTTRYIYEKTADNKISSISLNV
jgi:hypothetical protein